MTDAPNIDPFEVKICYDVTHQLDADEQISAIGGSSSIVFIGTNRGRVIHLKKDISTFVILGRFRLPIKQETRQIEFASALGVLLVLSDKVLFDIEIDSFQVVSNRPSTQCIAVNSNPIVDDPFCLQIAIATTSKQLHICERRNGKMESLQKLNTDGNVSAMSFARFTVCFASNGNYCIYNVSTKSVISLFPFDPLAIYPQVCSADREFFVSGMDGLLIFVTEEGVSTRPPMLFPSLPIDTIVYSSPYVYLRSKEEITVISLEDSRVSQTLRVPQAEVLCSLDGLVYISSHQNLYQIQMVTLEKQGDALFACGDFDGAISLYEKKLHKQFDNECLSNFVALKKKIAFKYIEERKFEKVTNLLISVEFNPEEVISVIERQAARNFWENGVEWSDSHQFLMDYLLQIRDLPIVAQSHTMVDTFLLKLFTLRGNPDAVLSLDNYHPNYSQSIEFLLSFGYYHCAAKMWLIAGDSCKAWEIWRHLANGEYEDATFKVEEVVGRLPSITDRELLIDVLLWLIPLSPERCIKVILDNSLLDHRTIKEVLHGDTKLLKLYLENIPVTEEVAKDLCNIYIKDITGGDLSNRHRFRSLLLKIGASDRSVMYDLIPSECGVERLLCDSSQSAADILHKVIVTYHDYDAAESICSHYASTQPDVCLHLLKFLEDSVVEDAESRMCSLLKCMGDTVDSRKVINSLPEFAALDQVATYMKRAIAKKQEERHMLRSKACLLQRKIERDKLNLPNEKIVIEDKAICMVCKEEISSSDMLIYLRTGYVIHSKCMKYENLCPLTNSILITPE